MRSCLSVASSSNDYENRTSGLRAQDVFIWFSLLSPKQPQTKKNRPWVFELLVLFLFEGRETEEGTVVFQEFADEEEGIHCDDAIADEASDVIGLGIILALEKYLIPKFGELCIVLLQVVEQFVLALANLFQRAVFSYGFLNRQH